MKHLIPAAFLAYLTRLLALGASPAEASVAIALSALMGLHYYIVATKKIDKPLNEKIQHELDELKSAVSGLKLDRTLRR